jgi:Ca2+-binding RTX toxin-like protein
MRSVTKLLAVAALSALCHTSPVRADDDIDRQDGVLYLTSTEPANVESFHIGYSFANDEIEVWHKAKINGEWVLLNEREYDFDSIDLILFNGDNDNDYLYCDPVDIPLVACGFGGNDNLIATGADCELYGGAGSDSLHGRNGNDYLDPGSDPLETGIVGNGGADTYVKWQSWQYDAEAGYSSYQDYQTYATETFLFDTEGDLWQISRKAKPNKYSIIYGGKVIEEERPTDGKTDFSQYTR